MQIICEIRTDTNEGRYLVSCARIRDVTVSHLVKKVIEVTTRDQLIEAVLDDDSRRDTGPYVHRFKEIGRWRVYTRDAENEQNAVGRRI